ncbi:hypothetical protein NST02_20875 [Robertmurraya sp. FSL W8-0741]|uniref:hypothetical protein n=1 Tax=Robertmurraya sp. FSL W8-0741 TaxID=2954629 RepID=UPI0030FA5B75
MKYILTSLFFIALLILAGCTDKEENRGEPVVSTEEEVTESLAEAPEAEDEEESLYSEEEHGEPLKNSNLNDKETLLPYSSEQIEYARVWRQFGPNQEIDELIVHLIPAGTPLDPNDDASVKYPEDVIQLTGTRLVDGSVTYSGNGNGTINIYNVPLRWYGGMAPSDELEKEKVYDEMKNIITNPKLESIEVDSGEEIIKLIELQKGH